VLLRAQNDRLNRL